MARKYIFEQPLTRIKQKFYHLVPTLRLIAWELDQTHQAYIIRLKHRFTCKIKKLPASIAAKNPRLVRQLSAEDANCIGYMAGISDTIKGIDTL